MWFKIVQLFKFFFLTFLFIVISLVSFVLLKGALPPPSLDEFPEIKDDYKLVDSLVKKKEVKLSTGITIQVLEAGIQKNDNMIIFSHGFPEIPYFVSKGYFVVVPDHRGYNENQDDSFDNYMNCNAEKAADDLKALMDTYKIEKSVIVGHDWGAGVAYRFALKYQERLKKLIILNMVHPLVKSSQMPFTQIFKSWYIFFFQIPVIPEIFVKARDFGALRKLLFKSSYTREDMKRLMVAHSRNEKSISRMLNWYRYMIRYEIPQKSIPNKKIEVPTKMIWGMDDVAIHIDLSKASMDESLVTNGELVYVDTHHFAQRGKPNEVNEEILKFLEK